MDKKLIKTVRLRRTSEGLSIRKLADIVGVSFSTLARLERGEGAADPNTRARLIQWLGEEAFGLGIGIERVAGVHFRAKKNITSEAVECLVSLAKSIWASKCEGREPRFKKKNNLIRRQPRLSKSDMEDMASELRKDLALDGESVFDPLELVVEGIEVLRISKADKSQNILRIQDEFRNQWSAMTVPLDDAGDEWVIVLNDLHNEERQRVSFMEELWHIFLGHELVEITRIAGYVGRGFDADSEHDAYYLASATLVPRFKIEGLLKSGTSVQKLSTELGVSEELIKYRIKRLGLWRKYSGRSVALSRNLAT